MFKQLVRVGIQTN